MRARKLSGCDKDNCPAVYLTAHGTALAPGTAVSHADGLTPGPGELIVELPLEVLREAVRVLDLEEGRA